MLMLLDVWHMSAEPAFRRLGEHSKVSSERSTRTHNNTITKAAINDDAVIWLPPPEFVFLCGWCAAWW